jgi:hypothetical protein
MKKMLNTANRVRLLPGAVDSRARQLFAISVGESTRVTNGPIPTGTTTRRHHFE